MHFGPNGLQKKGTLGSPPLEPGIVFYKLDKKFSAIVCVWTCLRIFTEMDVANC